MKVGIKYNSNQDWKYSEVNNIQDLPNYDQIFYLLCTCNQLSSLPNLPSTLKVLWCSNNKFIKKDQYIEGIHNNIMRIVPWTRTIFYKIEFDISKYANI